MPRKKKLKWADGKIKALSVWFCTEENEGMKLKYEDKFHKVGDILNNWQNKRLTLPGKITIIKRSQNHQNRQFWGQTSDNIIY